MTEYNDTDRTQDSAAQEELPVFNYKRLVSELISHWYLFVLFMGIGLAGAWLYNRYTTPMYSARASIMILEE